MKKFIKVICFTLLISLFSGNVIYAKNSNSVARLEIVVSNVSGYEDRVVVSGEFIVEGTAVSPVGVVVQIYDGDNLIAMEAKEVRNNSFSGATAVNLIAGKEYIAKVSNYDGGQTPTKTFTFIAQKSASPIHIVPNTGNN